MSETSLESIMKCSKEAIARAYMCKISTSVYTRCPLHYSVEMEKCPLNGVWCSDITPQDWEEVLNSEQEKRECLNPRS